MLLGLACATALVVSGSHGPKLPPRIGLHATLFGEPILRGEGPDVHRYYSMEAAYGWEFLNIYKKPRHRLTVRSDVLAGVSLYGPLAPWTIGTTNKFAFEYDTSEQHTLHAEIGTGPGWHTAPTPNHQSRGLIFHDYIGLGTETRIGGKRFIFWARAEHRSNAGLALGYGRLAWRPKVNFQNDGIDYPLRFVAQMILD